jgi:hypothetical protein
VPAAGLVTIEDVLPPVCGQPDVGGRRPVSVHGQAGSVPAGSVASAGFWRVPGHAAVGCWPRLPRRSVSAAVVRCGRVPGRQPV